MHLKLILRWKCVASATTVCAHQKHEKGLSKCEKGLSKHEKGLSKHEKGPSKHGKGQSYLDTSKIHLKRV